MGNSAYDIRSRSAYKETIRHKSSMEIFQEKKISKLMNPFGIKIREARDSATHPNSTPIMVFLDNTGSMGSIPEHIVKDGLDTLMQTLIKNGVPDAAVLFGFIGDHIYDDAPLQVGQFESGDKELAKWLTQGFIEMGGGSNMGESYLLAWLFAANHTETDHYTKRKKKGILFTIGDEPTLNTVEIDAQQRIFGYDSAQTATARGLLKEISSKWDVFHLHISQARGGKNPPTIDSWKSLLGDNLIIVDNYQKIPITIAKIVAKHEGVKAPSIDLMDGVDGE